MDVYEAVALSDGGAVAVGGYAHAQLVYDPHALVSHHPPGWRHRLVDLVTPPGMEVGAADARLGDPDDDGPRLRVGKLVLPYLKRLVMLGVDHNPAIGHLLYSTWSLALWLKAERYGTSIARDMAVWRWFHSAWGKASLTSARENL